MNQEWHSWKERHDKFYADPVEEGIRHSTWLENKRLVEEHNENKSHGYTLGLNHFADLVRQIILIIIKLIIIIIIIIINNNNNNKN